MELTTWIGFAVASAVLVAIPGPTVMLVVAYALGQGRKVALATAAGVILGDLVAMTLSLAGLGAVLATSATLFSVLKWFGVAYLLYLAVRLWRAPPVLAEAEAVAPGQRGIFGHAFAVTALNPKSIAFFIAFVPHFIDPAMPLLPQTVMLIATFVALGGINALAYALAVDRLRRLIRRPGVLKWVNRSGAVCLGGMGALTVALTRQ